MSCQDGIETTWSGEVYKTPNQNNTTYDFGNSRGAAPFLWKMPSTNTPFFPLHVSKNCLFSKNISKWSLEMKLDSPMLTSTSPLLLFRPIIMCVFLIINSKSRPSKRAIGSILVVNGSSDNYLYICNLLWANSVHFRQSYPFYKRDIASLYTANTSKWLPDQKAKQSLPWAERDVYISKHPTMHHSVVFSAQIGTIRQNTMDGVVFKNRTLRPINKILFL